MSPHALVYILKSLKNPTKIYIGITLNLDTRVKQHNESSTGYSKRYAPRKIETYITFDDDLLAYQFEKYLKNGSGQAFLKKHLIHNLKDPGSTKLPCLT